MMDNRQVFSHFTFFASLALMAALMFSPATLANTSDAAILDALNRTSDPEATLKWYVSSEADLDTISDPEDRAEAYHLLGRAYYQVGNSIQAQSMLAQAIELIGDRPDNAAFAASAFNDMGLVLVSRANLKDALLYFESAQDRAIAAGAPEAIVLSGINLVRTLLANANHQKLPILLARIKTNLDESTPSLSVAGHWLSYGQLLRKAVLAEAMPVESRLDVLQAYLTAQDQAMAFNDQHLVMYANGYLGELYEDEARFTDAMNYTREALFDAQALSDDTSLYKWQWQMARLHEKQGNTALSVDLYRQAVATLNRSRTSLTLGAGINFKQTVSPVFYEFADLLLKQAVEIADEQERQKSLEEVINVLEAVKLAEVEDYFDSECVVIPDQKIKPADGMSGSAVIYPVLLQDRIELLVQLPSGIAQFTVDVSASRLRDTVNEYRSLIETYDRDNAFMGPSRLLYSWLIEPAESALADSGIHTLVLVPDGPLRSIPISALHDGDQFLIQKYALATTPSISLTDPKPFARENVRVLASGLSEAVQGYSALPGVSKELDTISSVFETTIYKNDDYQLPTVAGELSSGDYDIVHFATHAEFNSDHNNSFLLTYDNRLTMNQLETTIGLRRFQSEPIELLVLSACQTAVGDERAALGLAGVAVQAGARSALATLWFINDQATSVLVADFYRQLQKEQQTKARALQTAQVNMITESQFSHPSFWAPFLLIGSWM
jgi:CHAT domain-containing protein